MTSEQNKTLQFFHKICVIVYIGTGTNFMFEELKLPKKFIEIYNMVSKLFTVLSISLILSEWGAVFTQKRLPTLELVNVYLFATTSVTLYTMYMNSVYCKTAIRELGFTLAVTLRGMFSDETIEKRMFKKTWRFVSVMGFIVWGYVTSRGLDAGYQAITKNVTFTTIVPVWPDVEDRRFVAEFVRIAHYIVWYVFVARVGSIYFIILALSSCLEHRFSMLRKYFIGLNSIFDVEGSDEEKEGRYEEALRHGIKMHSLTLRCAGMVQETCGVAFSSQVITNVWSLILLMIQWIHMEHTIANVLNIGLIAGVFLVGTGIFMWNAGDISYEASKLPSAMFHSGWCNCRGQSSVRVRKLLTIAMRQAQDEVVLKGLGIIEFSYNSYITIVKSSYSVFSVLY